MNCDQLEYKGEIYTRVELAQAMREGKVPLPKSDDVDTETSTKDVGAGIDVQNPQFHINTLNAVSRFLESVGVGQEIVPEFLGKDGTVIEGALAAANFLTGKVQFKEGATPQERAEAWDKLPEEAAHFWYRMLDNNSALKGELALSAALRNAKDTDSMDAYEEYMKAYKENPESMTEERVGQEISAAIKRIQDKNGSPEDYSFLDHFLNWVNHMVDRFMSFFLKSGGELDADVDSFEVAAMRILASDLTDVMTWNEYKMINNIVNFADKITDASVDNEHTLESVGDRMKEWENLLGKYKKRTKYLNKTLDKYFRIIHPKSTTYSDIQITGDSLTAKLRLEEKKYLKNNSGYTNIVPALKGLPDLLKKMGNLKISLDSKSLPVKVKAGEMKIYMEVLGLIKAENPTLKSISPSDFANEIHTYLEANYLLGFAEERDHLEYNVNQTFKQLSSKINSKVYKLSDGSNVTQGYIENLTESEISRMSYADRQIVAQATGLVDSGMGTDAVRHRKISLRFNDEYFKSGHFKFTPSAWGNLTPFYSKNSEVKDAVLLHELQNDQIERLWQRQKDSTPDNIKGRAASALDSHIRNMEAFYRSNLKGPRVELNQGEYNEPFRSPEGPLFTVAQSKPESFVRNALRMDQNPDTVLERLNEMKNLFPISKEDVNRTRQKVYDTYRAGRQWDDFVKRGGIDSILSPDQKADIKAYLHSASATSDYKYVKSQFESRFSSGVLRTITDFLKENYEGGMAAKYLQGAIGRTGQASFTPPKNPRNTRINTSYNSLIAYYEKQVAKAIKFATFDIKKTFVNEIRITKRNEEITRLLKLPTEKFKEIHDNIHANEKLLRESVLKRANEILASQQVTGDMTSYVEQVIENEAFKAYDIMQAHLDEMEAANKNIEHTLKVNLDYLTPLMHHLIQTHKSDYGEAPLYFSGYEVTKLTQGAEKTARIYAGPEEVNQGLAPAVGPMWTAINKFLRENGMSMTYVNSIPGLKNHNKLGFTEQDIFDDIIDGAYRYSDVKEVHSAGGYLIHTEGYSYKEPILYSIKPKHDVDTGRPFREMPFTFSKDKIIAGKKFLTVRPGSYQRGTYQDGKNLFNVYPYTQNKVTLSQYLNDTGMKKADFIRDFIGDEAVKYEHIRAFLDDDKPMHIYQIAKSTGHDDIIPEIADQRFQQQYANRMAMLQLLNSQMRDEKDPDKRQELRERRDTLREQAKLLRADETRSFEALLSMMKGDVATATKILDTRANQKSLEFIKGLTANYATMLMDQFEDVYDNLKDTSDVPGELSKLDINNFINSVIKLQDRVTSQTLALGGDMTKKLTGKGVLKVDGLPIDAKDINLGATWGYDTRFNNNPIVQSITKTIRDAQVAINLRMVEFRHTNNLLVKLLKKAGFNFDFMIQTNDKGRTGYLVDRLSSGYWEEYKKANDDIMAKMVFFANNHSFKINQSAQDVRDTRNFQYGLDHNNIVYNEGDVNSYEDQVRQRAQWYVDKMNPHTFVRLMEKVVTQPGRISKEEREFFLNFIENKGLYSEMVDGSKVQPLEMTAHEDWVDPKWQAIQAMPTTDPRRAFYDHMEKHLKEGHQMRRDEQGYIPWNFIPEKYKALGILSKVQQFAHDNLGQRLSINRDTINPATGEITKKIPLYMLNDVLSPENKSYDLGNVLEDFMKETWNYDEKRRVEEPVKMLMALLKAQKVYETNPDGSVKMVDNKEKFKDGLSNNYIQAMHRVAATIYGETQEQEFVTGTKLFTAAEKADMKMIKDEIAKLDITPQERQHALQYTSQRLEYTGTNPKIAKYVALSTKYQSIYDNSVNFTGSKAMNSLMFLSSVTYLGINLFAGMGELLQGYSQLFTESAGGRYFNDGQAAFAMGYAMSNITPWANDKKQNFHNISIVFDTVGDIFHEGEGRLKSKTEALTFAQYTLANYMTNTCFTIAMLKHDKIKDRSGIERSLFDSMKFDAGKVSWTKDIDQELYDKDGRPSQFLLSLMHKSDEILAYNRERKTFMDPIKVDAKMVGRMLGQFKKNWMISNFYYRFGAAKEANLTGGLDNQGFYITFWKEIMTPPKVEDPITGEMVNAPFNPLSAVGRFAKYLMRFSTIGKKLGFGPQEGEYSEMVEANLRKFMREFSMAMTIIGTMFILKSMEGGGDDDWIRIYILNHLARLQRDVMQFMDPMEFGSIIKNPMPVLSTVTDWYQLMSSTVSMGLLGDPHHKMLQHFTKGAINMTPYVRQGPAMYNKLHKAIVYGIH